MATRSPDPSSFPGNLLGTVSVRWSQLEPEEGRYDLQVIEDAIHRELLQGNTSVELHRR